jgi:hypothetical protein
MKLLLTIVLASAVALAAADRAAMAASGTSGSAVRGTGSTAGGVIGTGGTIIGGVYLPTTPAGGEAGMGVGIIHDDPDIQHTAYKKKAEDDYNAAVKAKAAGDMETATRLFVGVVELSKMHIDSPYPAQAFEELKGIAEQAAKEFAVARSMLGGDDPAAGLAELKRITRVYSGLDPAKQAGALALQLAADPSFQASLRTARLAQDLKKAAALEAVANTPGAPVPAPDATTTTSAGTVSIATKVLTEKEQEALRLARLVEVYQAYGRIIEQGGDTEPAKAAAAARTRLEQDKDLMVRLTQAQSETKARQYLGLAQNYFKAGLTARAREFCQKILSECPATPQAADAKALLDKMK